MDRSGLVRKRKVCVVTGTRADYGLLYWTIDALHRDSGIELQLVVTGTHLSPEFGSTYKQIENDGFSITAKAEILLSSDTPVAITKSIAMANISFAEIFATHEPDVVLVLGDRFEILAATTAALVARIPVAHCHGGELTEGAMDDAFRHAITKMSHIHFTATEQYRMRVIQLGEHPNTVHNVGGLGIENINRLQLLERSELERSLDFTFKRQNLLVTFHPVTLEKLSAGKQFHELLNALRDLKDTGLLFTYPNADTDGRVIIKMIKEFVQQHRENAIAFESLGQIRYLSTLKHIDALVGNSSSGLTEAPSFKVATINIGDRQKGRIRAESVIDCDPEHGSINRALEYAFDPTFRQTLVDVENPYGRENASEKIIEVLKSVELHSVLKKDFYNLNFK